LQSERTTCEPVWFSCTSQHKNYGPHGTIFQHNFPLWLLYSRILKKLLMLHSALAFCKVVKIKIFISISMLINSFPSSRKFKFSVKCKIQKSTIL
jgi:hypothetical protein